MKNLLGIALIVFATQSFAADEAQGPLEQLGEQMDNMIEDTIDYTYVLSEISKDPLLNPLDIQVKLDGSTAHLSGTVHTDMQYERAITIASSLDKIEDVNADKLIIEKSDSVLQDMATSAKIRGKLLRLKFMDGKDIALWPINIDTKNGHVYITGKVDSKAEATMIDKALQSVEGVKQVHSDFTIEE